MTTLELVAAIGGGPTITAAGVGLWKLGRFAIQKWGENAERDDAREERTEKRLWSRLKKVETRLDDCERKHQEAERRHQDAEKRGADCERRSEAQGQKIVELEGHVATLQGIALRSDNTAQFRARLTEWARSTPPEPLPAVRREESE